MKKSILFVLSALFLVLSGCITITEKYSFRKDGSGTMEYIIDMSELYAMMASFSDSTTEEMQMNESFEEVKAELESIDGISKVTLTGNPESYIMGIQYDFKDAVALNKAMNLLLNKEGEGTSTFVAWNKKSFTRYSILSDEFSKEALLGETEGMDESMAESMLDGMKYKLVVSMPADIKTVETSAEYVQDDKRTVTVEAGFLKILNEKNYLQTEIKTK